MKPDLTGLGVAMVTPFNADKTVDYLSLEKLLDKLIPDIDYLVVFGTTSEAPVLTEDEKLRIFDIVRQKVNGKIPVIIGLGGNNTTSLVEKLQTTDFSGADAILSVTPYYNKPDQRGLIAHYSALAEKSPLPIILYNVPGRTAVNLTAETTLELAKNEKFIAIKEASGNFDQIMTIVNNKPDNFQVISGDDALTLPLMAIGVTGVISVIGNAFPSKMRQMVKSILSGNPVQAKTIHYELLPFINAIFKEGNPAGIKALLSAMDILKNNLRLPLVPVSEAHQQVIENLLVSSL